MGSFSSPEVCGVLMITQAFKGEPSGNFGCQDET
jgi:hypothetical protein